MLENCNIKENVSMKEYTSFKTGGIAKLLVEPCDTKGVCSACKEFKDYYVLGNGTNLLVADEGIEKPVIHIGKAMSEIAIDGERIICQAGALLSAVAQKAYKASLEGMEFAHGIPGSIGGAVSMNAGAYGGEMCDIVEKVEYVAENGEIKEISSQDAAFGYRKSFFSDKSYIITRVYLKLRKGEGEKILEKMKELATKRREKQPLEYPSAGSAFKRPEGYFAAALIQEANLKGECVGGACVSEKHAGFIINKDNATTEDVLALMKKVQTVVFEKSGVMLSPEVKVWK